MKKLICILLINLGIFGYSQVIVGNNNTLEDQSLTQEDLYIKGNLKVEAVENLCHKDNEDIFCDVYNQVFLDTKDHNTMVKGNIPKIFQRVVFYVKVGDKDEKITYFDTKIDSKKYAAILSGSSILDTDGEVITLPEIEDGLNATKELRLFERQNSNNTTWAFSANFTANVTSSPIWKVELLLMDKSYVSNIQNANPNAIYDTKATTVPREKTEGNVGIGEDTPKANLDVKGKLRIGEVSDVTTDPVLKDRTLPLAIDISSKDNGDKTDSWGILKATENSKIAYPVNLHIKMDGNDKDFVYFLRLGLNPKKYTPILANYQLTCKQNVNWGINFKDGKQPTPNNYVTKWNGNKDWALYLDYANGSIVGNCTDLYWNAFLLIFRNENLINVPVYSSNKQQNTYSNPITISNNYDSESKGYFGSIEESPLP